MVGFSTALVLCNCLGSSHAPAWQEWLFWYSPWECSDCLFLEVMKSWSCSASSVCIFLVCAFVCHSPASKSLPLNQVRLLLHWGIPVLKRTNGSDLAVISSLFLISFLENLTLLSPWLWHSFCDYLWPLEVFPCQKPTQIVLTGSVTISSVNAAL